MAFILKPDSLLLCLQGFLLSVNDLHRYRVRQFTVRKQVRTRHGKFCLDSIMNSPRLSPISYHSGQVSLVLWILSLQLQ